METYMKTIPIFTGSFGDVVVKINKRRKYSITRHHNKLKLSENVRTLIASEITPKNFKGLETKIYKSPSSISTIHFTLNSIFQKGNNTSYRDKITLLISDLTNLQNHETQMFQFHNRIVGTVFDSSTNPFLNVHTRARMLECFIVSFFFSIYSASLFMNFFAVICFEFLREKIFKTL